MNVNKPKILLIPDTQCKQGVPTEHLKALGNYIVEKQPDYIVHIGDHFDMPSLSSYSSRKQLEGARVLADIKAGQDAMDELMKPLRKLQRKQKLNKKKVYRPKKIYCLGNHEERLNRYIEANPNLEGILDYPSSFGLEHYGWEVYDFLMPVNIEGIMFAHYFYNPMSGRPYGGTCETKLKNIKASFVMGHQQGLSVATTTGNDGKKYWGIVAGSYYMHDEGYIGHQANDHWRGAVMLHEVHDGDCDPMFIGLDYLLKEYL